MVDCVWMIENETTTFPIPNTQTTNDMSHPVAEIVAASTRQFEAEVYDDESALPDFGAWVEVRLRSGTVLYAVVSHVERGTFEPTRRVRAFGLDDDEVRREYPHLPGLACTTLRALVLAHRPAPVPGKPTAEIRQTLAPDVPRLHDPVYTVAPDVVRHLGPPTYDVLRTLLTNPDPAVPVDELLVAALTNLRRTAPDRETGETRLVEAARTLTRLLRDDHERLHAILRRVDPG